MVGCSVVGLVVGIVDGVQDGETVGGGDGAKVGICVVGFGDEGTAVGRVVGISVG